MEKPYSGLTAQIKINGVKVAYLNNLELNPGEETEITLFWMWAYSESSSQDNIDTSIGNYMNSHPNLTYDITVSFTYSKESSQCGN